MPLSIHQCNRNHKKTSLFLNPSFYFYCMCGLQGSLGVWPHEPFGHNKDIVSAREGVMFVTSHFGQRKKIMQLYMQVYIKPRGCIKPHWIEMSVCFECKWFVTMMFEKLYKDISLRKPSFVLLYLTLTATPSQPTKKAFLNLPLA